MKDSDELTALNKAYAIFKKHRIENTLYPSLSSDMYIIREETVYDIIQEVVAIMEKEHPLWNFGKKPDEH